MRTGTAIKKFRPGDLAPITGTYRVTHELRHRDRHEVVIIRGEQLPTCRTCKLDVSFEIIRPVSHITHDWDFSGPCNLVVARKRDDSQNFRLFHRAPIRLPVRLESLDSAPLQIIHGFSADLSVGGLGAVIRREVPASYRTEILKVSFEKGRESLSIKARFRYQHGMRYGFQFINVTTVEQDTLRRVIARCRPGAVNAT